VYLLQLEYFETVLNPYFTPDARESLKSLQGVLLEKATESMTETMENPGHHRRPTRGSEDALADDRQGMSVSPDDLIVRNFFCIFFVTTRGHSKQVDLFVMAFWST
jgi:exocyst complex component 2